MGAENFNFFRSSWNIVEFITTILILIFYVVFYVLRTERENRGVEHEEDILELYFFILRYAIQTFRIALLLRGANKASEAAKYTKDISFDTTRNRENEDLLPRRGKTLDDLDDI
eukprot:TRINITY_DN0_c657_g1_i4.p1 TRINITY_DN0_c657_g1~~TRINITY_DN0_c657_g1_i4.p1  ORF type:complete len:114 (-),score=19.15 TRINITY_DN0_c657_g1_i4:42-383(-)